MRNGPWTGFLEIKQGYSVSDYGTTLIFWYDKGWKAVYSYDAYHPFEYLNDLGRFLN